jgi:uncharacterized protein (DUF2252 family)
MKDAKPLILDFNKYLSPTAQLAKFTAIQESAFRFYRGTCHLFYDRLASMGPPKAHTKAWICGDLHLENFGSYKGDNRLVYFDLNDFDEAYLAPLSAEVLRFATAILMATDLFKYSHKQAKDLIKCGLEEYRHTIIRSKALMMERDIATGLMKDFFDQLTQEKRQEFIKRISERKGKKTLIKIDNVHNHPIDKEAHEKLMHWCRHEFAKADHLSDMEVQDCAYRVAGTGSIGVERYMILTFNKKNGKSYLLDLKEAKPSSLIGHIDVKQPKWSNEAERVVTIQTRMQFCPPALLRPMYFNKKWFVLKELQPVQDKVDLAQAKGKLTKLQDIILPMARLAAYAHLRGTGRQGSSTADELAASVSRTKWLPQRYELAQELAAQTKKDYKSFLEYKIS